ncbi:MAG: hypothetical protein JRH16_14840 [Deltaproteobacteria bacterium]|nr:hypothetical protein [Deltaproteobacteria bacterium]MBW2361256.1 hypothetical protein [Deltaproteobacteria bacterium]
MSELAALLMVALLFIVFGLSQRGRPRPSCGGSCSDGGGCQRREDCTREEPHG